MADTPTGTVIHVNFMKRPLAHASNSIGYTVGLLRQQAAEFEVGFAKVRRRLPRSHPLYWNPFARGPGIEYSYAQSIQRILADIRRELDSVEEKLDRYGDTAGVGSQLRYTIDLELSCVARKLVTLESFKQNFEILHPPKQKKNM